MLTPEESTSAISHRPRDGSLTQSPPETELGGESPNARITRDATVNEDVATRRALQMITSLTVQPTTDPQTLQLAPNVGHKLMKADVVKACTMTTAVKAMMTMRRVATLR